MLGVTLERWNGEEREIVERPDSVAVVAVDQEDNVVLVRQFRAPARRPLLELPAGTVDEGEEPVQTAKRELEEETGLRGGAWRRGPVFYTTPGFCRERMHLFFAEGLEQGQARPHPGEEVELVRWPAAEIAGRLAEIEDGKTLAGLLSHARSNPRT
jgi:ADP-ribose pyrophosphatase